LYKKNQQQKFDIDVRIRWLLRSWSQQCSRAIWP